MSTRKEAERLKKGGRDYELGDNTCKDINPINKQIWGWGLKKKMGLRGLVMILRGAETKKAAWCCFRNGGERGIRTPDTGWPYTRFPGVLLQPLGHLTAETFKRIKRCSCERSLLYRFLTTMQHFFNDLREITFKWPWSRDFWWPIYTQKHDPEFPVYSLYYTNFGII